MPDSKPRILLVVGARPNFMKVAPILRALDARNVTEQRLLHSGQHYDDAMSGAFLRDLEIRPPDYCLSVGSGSHGSQTALALQGTEEVLLRDRWSLVVVVGDVNSTVAAALAAAKLGIPVAHVEAGLRSRDRSMPEELNRIVTDQLSELCLTPSRDADANLRAEGISEDRIAFVGNVMIDSLRHTMRKQDGVKLPVEDLRSGTYVVATLHRPSNVDNPEQLREIISAVEEIASRVPVVFPIHPRTAKALDRSGINVRRARVVEPLGYREMLALQSKAGLVITDSGGIQEETTVLGVPCLTLRANTERPVTISEGTNRLVASRTSGEILTAFEQSWGTAIEPRVPEGWDGKAGERTADAILNHCA